MLTDAQLRSTAARLIAARLTYLDDVEDHEVDKLLCRHHCDDADCDRTDQDAVQEIRGVHRHMQTLAGELRAVVDRYQQDGPR